MKLLGEKKMKERRCKVEVRRMPDPKKCKEKGDYDMRKMQRCARISTISTRLAFINAADLALQQNRLMSGGEVSGGTLL